MAIAPLRPTEDSLRLSGTLDGEAFEAIVGDVVTLSAIRNYGAPPADAIPALLRLAGQVVATAHGGIQIHLLERELEAAVATTNQAITGVLDHFNESVSPDGTVIANLKSVLGDLSTMLNDTLVSHTDPTMAGSLLASIQQEARRLHQTITDDHAKIIAEVQRTNQDHTHQITRAIRDIRDLDPGSGLGAKLNQIEAGLRDVHAALAANQAVLQIHQRPSEGRSYEALLAETVGDIARRAGDSAEHTGDHPGYLMSKARLAKRGDVTCRVCCADNLGIVLEAMDREKSKLTRTIVERELEEAKVNRGASFAIAVVPTADNSLMCFQPFQDLGQNRWAVVLPREPKDRNDALALEFVYHLARQRALASVKQEGSVDIALMGQIVDEIREKLGLCRQIKQQMDNAAKSQEEATRLVTMLERQIRDHIQLLVDGLKGASEPGEEIDG